MQNESNKEPRIFMSVDETDVQEWLEACDEPPLTPEELEEVWEKIIERDDRNIILYEVLSEMLKTRKKI